MKMTDTFCISEDVVAREVSGELVLLNLATGQYFGLDAVGMRIWELVADEPRNLAQICDVIEAEFDAPRDQIEADILALASDMSDKELIVAGTA